MDIAQSGLDEIGVQDGRKPLEKLLEIMTGFGIA
jgi:hypothetical protein